MSNIKGIIYVKEVRDQEERLEQIKEILGRGKIVRFTNIFTGLTKDVNSWNPDEDGDLAAFRSSGGKTKHVCPTASQYVISEIDQ